MSIVFPTVATEQLKSAVRKIPTGLLNTPTIPPTTLMAEFNWATDYSAGTAKPNVNVLVNVAIGGAQPPIDVVRSVKIDNLGNPCPVYVFFLDSTDTVVAPANTEIWTPVATNSKLANVILEGATDGAGVGRTRVYFSNYIVPPYVNTEINQAVALYKGSPSIQRTNTLQPGYGPPALGDQVANVFFGGNQGSGTPQTQVVLAASATPTNFYYFTDLYFNINQCNAITPANTGAQFQFKFYNQTTGDILFRWRTQAFTAGATFNFVMNVPVLQANGLNFRLLANANYALQLESVASNSGAGLGNWGFDMTGFLAYTENPN